MPPVARKIRASAAASPASTMTVPAWASIRMSPEVPVAVIEMASAPVPIEESKSDESPEPPTAMVRSSASVPEVKVKFMSSAPSMEIIPVESIAIPPVPESMSIPPAALVVDTIRALAAVPEEVKISDVSKDPAVEIVRSWEPPSAVRVTLEETPAPSMEKASTASMVMSSAESMSMSPPEPVESMSTAAVPVPLEVR